MLRGRPEVCAKIPAMVQVAFTVGWPPPSSSELEKLMLSAASWVSSGI